ncbi:Uncharacterized conserved protein YlxW, UPF0749 family [Desulfonispora thiosulfatigenes DSM 11270]|uniref:Uncharacterized conserved protein YlxW, UPF0749 family n=1 Tax=Desulfonispora thiosulfatigenes DSM 11270 TaxID=656914 RepID=A0A1W1V911_DESTI|nr:DUF881 domain-containing protein [Desulfonispora thiosulfatigenes]SMB89541.1 Uncharacterized conserved protein YlxW, UPF0749 family [Desulfonispora thiosulfatigenes DSM 11270]
MLKKEWILPLTITMFLLGLLLSNQFQIQTRITSDLTMQKTEHLIAMVKDLKDKRDSLDQEIYSIEEKVNEIQYSGLDTDKIISNLKSEKQKLQIINGESSLTGPGIKIVIEQDSPIIYVDIIRIINELWAAGAEAISINGHRVTFGTTIFYSEKDFNTFVTVNDSLVTYPLIINAIGNSQTLEKGLTLPGGIIDNLALFHAYPYIVQEEEIYVPATKQQPTKNRAKETKLEE